jgi:glutamyl-Q tRNA(Asp) synthetase
MAQPVFRFAPSPNGYLHLGHALSALMNFEMARAVGGRMLLRIEDIDGTRCRPEYEAAIYEDLAWLGISWEQPVLRQSDQFDRYGAALVLLERDGLIYPAFESRAEIARLVAAREAGGVPWPRDPDGSPLYPGQGREISGDESARRIAAGEPYALRLDMAAACARAGQLSWMEIDDAGEQRTVPGVPAAWGDVILGRKETPTSYHLSVVVDDALQGVTHVVRGQDLAPATGVHRVLQALLGYPVPTYRHHRLILGPDGQKLAKSTGATALRVLRGEGMTPADIRRLVGLA